MIRNQQGFSLLEIVVAFTIIAIVTILTVNIIAQNGARIHRINSHASVTDAAETALALLRMKIGNDSGDVKKSYAGVFDHGLSWQASVSHFSGNNPGKAMIIRLFRVDLDILEKGRKEPVYRLATILADR